MTSQSYPHKVPDSKLEQVVVMSKSDPETVNSIWSPTMFPPMEISTNNVKRKLNVVLISTETEDKQLLHSLLVKTRSK